MQLVTSYVNLSGQVTYTYLSGQVTYTYTYKVGKGWVILITDGIRITHLRITPQWGILRWGILTFTER